MKRKTTETKTESQRPPLPEPVARIGLDWGHFEHAFAMQTAEQLYEEGLLKHSSELLHQWVQDLGKRFGGKPVAIAVEASRGAVINALLEYPWVIIYPLNPLTVSSYRKTFTPSNASDDLPDARLALEILKNHSEKLRPLDLMDPQTVELKAIVETRRDLVQRRTQVISQLIELLRSYYPQALDLLGSMDTILALDFLNRWPDLISLKASRPSTIKHFYYTHNLRSQKLIEERLEIISKAVALTNDQNKIRITILQLKCLLDQMRDLNKHIKIFEEESIIAFAAHPEAYLFKNLPGAGKALAPRLCVLFGCDRTLFADASCMQKLIGVAPVREKSGKTLWTHWRWQAPTFMRQTMVEWAGQTVKYSEWARIYYNRMEAKGKSHWVILRALAFKWLRILWKCWQTRIPYDEATYLKQLIMRKSPNAVTPGK